MERFKALSKKELVYQPCQRCFVLYSKQKLLRVDEKSQIAEFDYDKTVVDRICSERGRVHVIIVVDLLDLPNSIYAGWSKVCEF